MRIVFIGPPGVGKGTQSQRLVERLKIAHLSTGDMLRQAVAAKSELGRRAESYMASGQLVPDELILELVAERLQAADCSGGYLLDGFPRTLPQAQALDRMLAERRTPLDAVVELTADSEELVRRMVDRGRADDRPEVIRQRLAAYQAQTAPLCDYYRGRGLLASIDGQGTPQEVFERVHGAVIKLADK